MQWRIPERRVSPTKRRVLFLAAVEGNQAANLSGLTRFLSQDSYWDGSDASYAACTVPNGGLAAGKAEPARLVLVLTSAFAYSGNGSLQFRCFPGRGGRSRRGIRGSGEGVVRCSTGEG